MAPGDFVGDGLGYEGRLPCHLVKISAARTSRYALGNPHMPDSWPIPSGRRRFPSTSFAGGGAAGAVARALGPMLGPLQVNSPRSSECVGQSVSLSSGSFDTPRDESPTRDAAGAPNRSPSRATGHSGHAIGQWP